MPEKDNREMETVDGTTGRDEAVVIFTTAGNPEAEVIARHLVEERLAACVNVTGVRSYYRWQGQSCEDPEQLLIIKTVRGKAGKAMEAIRALHSYELPEMIVLAVTDGYPPYLRWIRDETSA